MGDTMPAALDRLGQTIERVEARMRDRYMVSASVDIGDGHTLMFKKLDGDRHLWIACGSGPFTELARASIEWRTRAFSALFTLADALDAAQAEARSDVYTAIGIAERWLSETEAEVPRG